MLDKKKKYVICFHEKWINVAPLGKTRDYPFTYCADCGDTYSKYEQLGEYCSYGGFDLKEFKKMMIRTNKEYGQIRKRAKIKEIIIPQEVLKERITAARQQWPDWDFEPILNDQTN